MGLHVHGLLNDDTLKGASVELCVSLHSSGTTEMIAQVASPCR